MMGCGVGFSVRREHIHNLPKVKKKFEAQHILAKDTDLIVPDSREGWISLLRKVLDSAFNTGQSFTYSTILVRGHGEKIHGFGGTASGPQILIDGITNIVKILNDRVGKKLRSIDCLYISNILGQIVVAGNVRRSSEIAIGDADDVLFLKAKRWDIAQLPNWVAMSNNTICADTYDYTSPLFWHPYESKDGGECYGLFNLNLCQTQGRLGEFIKDDGEGANPCSEILPLHSGEVCNLSELYLNNLSSKEEMLDCAILLYKLQKAICNMKYLHEKTNRIVHKNNRIGIGITGICQALDKVEWCDYVYKEVRKFDKEWSQANGWPISIKITTIKPSGTLSLLSNSTPGIHPAYSPFYIRRVRMSSNDTLVQLCREAGYKTEYVRNFDGTDDFSTMIVEFPCAVGESTLVAKDVSAIKQLELIKKLQTVWCDNGVSCTVYFKTEELDEIKQWLKENYENSIKSVSFLRHQDHGFHQAPYEEISKETYEKLISKIKPLDIQQLNTGELLSGIECSGGACPVR